MSRWLALLLSRLLALAPNFSLSRLLDRFLTGSCALSLSRSLVFSLILRSCLLALALRLSRSLALLLSLAHSLAGFLSISRFLCRFVAGAFAVSFSRFPFALPLRLSPSLSRSFAQCLAFFVARLLAGFPALWLSRSNRRIQARSLLGFFAISFIPPARCRALALAVSLTSAVAQKLIFQSVLR